MNGYKRRLFPGPLVQRIPPNPNGGRDFVVSDVHGRYTQLLAELRRVGFNCRRDRLFSVGDLIDRGPSNLECLGLLRMPWFRATLGNHETMLLTALRGRYSAYHNASHSFKNGGDWVLRLSSKGRKELDSLIPLLSACPLVMVVEHPAGPFNITHAEFSRRHEPKLLQNSDLENLELLESCEPRLTWGRGLNAEARSSAIAMTLDLGGAELLDVTTSPLERGLHLTYVGHNAQKRCLLHRSHLYFDRGAGYMEKGDRLLVLEHADVVRRLSGAGVLR